MRGTPEQGQADRVLVLSDADRAALNAQASRGLLLALAAQGALGLAAAVIAGLSEGQRQVGRRWRGQERISYPMRCSHCAWLSAYGPDGPVLYLLFGELIKLFATALLLWLLSRVAQGWLVWPAALLGLILTLKGYLLLLMFRKLS